MELAIGNIIKIIIGVVVIVTIILGVYFSMKDYVIPYFAGIGPGGDDDNGNYGGGSIDICNGKTGIGYFQFFDPGRFYYEHDFFFTKEGVRTEIYLEEPGVIKVTYGRDSIIGKVSDTRIEIYSVGDAQNVIKKQGIEKYTDSLDGAYLGGLQVCK